MNTTELGEQLRAATDGLAPPPGFAETVVRGGRGRRARRRVIVAASVVAAVATSATVVVSREVPPRTQAADVRLTQPTGGDLAGDQTFLDEALTVWRHDLTYAPEARWGHYDQPLGEPRVFWAGNTPAGPAAIVVQQFRSIQNEGTEPKVPVPPVAEGLVATDPGDGNLKLLGTRDFGVQLPGWADYYKFGPGDRTLLIVDHGKPLHYSFGTSEKDGEFTRRWQRAQPHDGVVLVEIPMDSDPDAAVAFEGSDPPEEVAPPDIRAVENPGFPRPITNVYERVTASAYLASRMADPNHRERHPDLLDWGHTAWEVGMPTGLSDVERDSLWAHRRVERRDPTIRFFTSEWTITGGLPDGRFVILKETQAGWDPPRLTVLVSPSTDVSDGHMVDGGTVDAGAVLPVRFRIPGGGGWLVADKGEELSYRTARDGVWRDAGRDAALLPDDAVDVRVGDHVVGL